MRFHQLAGGGNPEHGLVMRREATGMRTVSITSVFISPCQTYIRYRDLGGRFTVFIDMEKYHRQWSVIAKSDLSRQPLHPFFPQAAALK